MGQPISTKGTIIERDAYSACGLSLYSAADGRAISRGEVGFDATAVLARGGGAGGGTRRGVHYGQKVGGCGIGGGGGGGDRSGAWTLALANRGEVRLYRPMWGVGGGSQQ